MWAVYNCMNSGLDHWGRATCTHFLIPYISTFASREYTSLKCILFSMTLCRAVTTVAVNTIIQIMGVIKVLSALCNSNNTRSHCILCMHETWCPFSPILSRDVHETCTSTRVCYWRQESLWVVSFTIQSDLSTDNPSPKFIATGRYHSQLHCKSS